MKTQTLGTKKQSLFNLQKNPGVKTKTKKPTVLAIDRYTPTSFLHQKVYTFF